MSTIKTNNRDTRSILYTLYIEFFLKDWLNCLTLKHFGRNNHLKSIKEFAGTCTKTKLYRLKCG